MVTQYHYYNAIRWKKGDEFEKWCQVEWCDRRRWQRTLLSIDNTFNLFSMSIEWIFHFKNTRIAELSLAEAPKTSQIDQTFCALCLSRFIHSMYSHKMYPRILIIPNVSCFFFFCLSLVIFQRKILTADFRLAFEIFHFGSQWPSIYLSYSWFKAAMEMNFFNIQCEKGSLSMGK